LMVKSNINLALVSKQARHSSIAMTMRYAHPSDDMIKDAIDVRPLFLIFYYLLIIVNM
jgi:hypothetical protein